MCSPPSSENDFVINDFSALQTKWNELMSKTCTEPAMIPGNTTVLMEVAKDKSKFFQFEVIFSGKKLIIKIRLFTGKVKLFYSFPSRNPKDPAEFLHLKAKSFFSQLADGLHLKKSSFEADEEFVRQVIDRPADLHTDVVFVGIRSREEENKVEMKLEDCQQVTMLVGDDAGDELPSAARFFLPFCLGKTLGIPISSDVPPKEKIRLAFAPKTSFRRCLKRLRRSIRPCLGSSLEYECVPSRIDRREWRICRCSPSPRHRRQRSTGPSPLFNWPRHLRRLEKRSDVEMQIGNARLHDDFPLPFEFDRHWTDIRFQCTN